MFPGLAVGEALEARGLGVRYLISEKEVDQRAVRGLPRAQVVALPAVGWERGGLLAFARGFLRARRACLRLFRESPPEVVLTLGGFVGVAPVWAGGRLGAATFLHEANSIPGRANRWLAHLVEEAFVYFPTAAERLWHQRVRVVGMPVRAPFRAENARDPAACRLALGLRPSDPVLLVTGGSQGARALNELLVRTVPLLRLWEPRLQVIHLTGAADYESVRQALARERIPALVRPFLTEMELALGAATVMVSRAGASSLAELAALGVPAVLVPYPHAADNHQYHNARAFADTGAARLLVQAEATPEALVRELRALLREEALRAGLRRALARWHTPDAAERLAAALAAARRKPHPDAPELLPGPAPAPAKSLAAVPAPGSARLS